MKRLREMEGFIDVSSSKLFRGRDTPSSMGYIAFHHDGRLVDGVSTNLLPDETPSVPSAR
jgi:hypothetical protein